MKKIFLSLLVASQMFGCELPKHKIVSYDPSHKEGVLKVAFEDPLQFFGGADAVTKGYMTQEQFNATNKQTMEAILNNPEANFRILMVENNVAGFVEFNKTRERSIESMAKMMAEKGMPCDPQQLSALMTEFKKTDAECNDYALIECLAVSRDFRKQGYGKALLNDAMEKIKQRWPLLTHAHLTVNESNIPARKLYEGMGFIQNQAPHLKMMMVAEYKKALQ